MTRGNIREYTEAGRLRYLWASKKEKGRILDKFTQVTRLQRKTATLAGSTLFCVENVQKVWRGEERR